MPTGPAAAVVPLPQNRSASARALYDRFVVVLGCSDDREGPELDEALAAALEELPIGSMIALAARAEPQLSIGRLRAHHRLAEVRTSDLAMAMTEATSLLRAEGGELPQEDVERLVERTEGWAAALYLAALALRETPADVSSFGGGHHLMFEYLRDEVLARLPPDLNEFA